MKKILSLLLSIVMLFSVTTGLTMTAHAATGSEIVAYARQFIGYPYVWGTQGPNSFDCSGFVQYVFKHFGISLPASSSSYWNNPTAYGTVVGAGSTANAQAGDVISWSGHVAIYTENGRCVEALNTNYGVTESVPVNSHTNGTNYKVIRINGVSEVSVPMPVVGDNKNYVSVGESITFWYSGLTECSKVEFYLETDGKVYYTKESTSSREFVTYFENEGIYDIYVGGYYNGKWYYSDKITVYVFNPKLKSSKTSVYTDEEVTFTYSGLSACQTVSICFETNGNTYYLGDSTSSRTYKNYFEKPGVYYVYAKGTIKNYTTASDKIKITVTCKHIYNKKVTKAATCTATGTLINTCSKCGYSYTSSIPATGHNYSSWSVTRAATCQQEGIETRVCKNDSSHKETRSIAKRAHSYDNGNVTKAATTSSTGIKTYTCTVCGETKTESIPKLDKDGLIKENGKWYYYKNNTKQKGWQKISKKWYYFNKNGIMQTGWQKISGKWYLFNSSGAMLTGWQKSGGKWYYFNSSGAMQTGWLKLSGKWYYLNSDGSMVANTSKKIGKKTYKFNSSGVCQNP